MFKEVKCLKLLLYSEFNIEIGIYTLQCEFIQIRFKRLRQGKDRTKWPTLGEAYDQQWTAIG